VTNLPVVSHASDYRGVGTAGGIIFLAHAGKDEYFVVHGNCPKRKAKTIKGTKLVIEPVAWIPQMGW